jgi:hypothetical protein
VLLEKQDKERKGLATLKICMHGMIELCIFVAQAGSGAIGPPTLEPRNNMRKQGCDLSHRMDASGVWHGGREALLKLRPPFVQAQPPPFYPMPPGYCKPFPNTSTFLHPHGVVDLPVPVFQRRRCRIGNSVDYQSVESEKPKKRLSSPVDISGCKILIRCGIFISVPLIPVQFCRNPWSLGITSTWLPERWR